MGILNRYIARLYLVNVCVLLVLLSGFVVTIDVIINLRRFSQAAERVTGAGGAGAAEGVMESVRHVALTVILVIDLWWPRLLQLFGHLLGVVLIAGMGFTCAQLVRHREFVAMLAGGISLRAAASPFVIVALVFLGAQAVNQEFVLPAIAPLLTRQPNDSGRRDLAAFPVRLESDGERRLFHSPRFDPTAGVLETPWIAELDEEGRIARVIEAERATWDGTGWELLNGRLSEIGTDPSAGQSPEKPMARLDSALDPTRLKVRRLKGFGQSLSWAQVSRLLQEPGIDAAERSRLDRLRWGRIGALASSLVTLIAVLPLFLRREPSGMIGPAIRAAPLALAGLAAAAMSSTLALPGLPAVVGVFIPTLALIPIAAAMMSGLKT